MPEKKKILEVKHLKQYFKNGRNVTKAVDDVSFDIYEGETFGLVGESGSGKTTTGRSILQLYKPTSGEVIFEGKNVENLKSRADKLAFTRDAQMIFQDPYASLNPRMTVEDIIAEGLDIHHLVKNKEERSKRVEELLETVGLNESHASRFPHEFSGGQRQRIGIARALAVEPKFIVADEPISALDVTVQAEILDLMKDLQKRVKTSIIFITHDLGVVAGMADRVAVMYAGEFLEFGGVDEIFYDPQHPYTWGLINSMPTLESDTLESIPGTPPNLLDPPKGDPFAPRNKYAMKIDVEKKPPFFKVSDTHYAATWLLAPGAPKVKPPVEIQRRWKKYDLMKKENKLPGVK